MSCADEPCALFPGFPGCPGAESNKAEEGPERETVTHSPEDALPEQLIFIAVENPASAILVHAVLPGQMRVSFIEIKATRIWLHFLLQCVGGLLCLLFCRDL